METSMAMSHGAANAPSMETALLRPVKQHRSRPLLDTSLLPALSLVLVITEGPYMDTSRPEHAGQGTARAVYGAAWHRPRCCQGKGLVNSPARAAYALSWQGTGKGVM